MACRNAAGAGPSFRSVAGVAVAEPTMTGRAIAAWSSFSLIAAYELLMRQVHSAAGYGATERPSRSVGRVASAAAAGQVAMPRRSRRPVAPLRDEAGGSASRCVAIGPGQPDHDRERLMSLVKTTACQYGPSRTVGTSGQAIRTGR
jgi:hypothetical protein